MPFREFDPDAFFRAAWGTVRIARPVRYPLFTFGETELPYYLVVDSEKPREPVTISQGEVKITRPLIITPENAGAQFQNFFDEGEEYEGIVDFLMTRSAAFRNLQLANHQTASRIVSDSVDEAVHKLNRQLDSEEEDRIAVLTAPYGLGGVAVLKYAADRVFQSAESNIQELRERGFLDF